MQKRNKSSAFSRIFKSSSLGSIPEELISVTSTMGQNDTPQVRTSPNPFESLRIPDAIKDLPNFEGNPRLLYEFISNVEEILSILQSYDGTTHGQIILRAIRNKIVGQANEVLNMFGTPLNWDTIKENLILHYSDKRSETSLIRDLHNLKQGNRNVEHFYSEIIELQSLLLNNTKIHEKDPNVIKAKQELFSEMSLNSLLIGLREPLGSIIRASKPDTLANAFSLCIKEQNIYYMRTDIPRYNRPYNQNKSFERTNTSDYYNSRQHPYNSQQTIPYQNQIKRSPSFNQNPFRGPSNNSYNNNYNNNNYKQEPMDATSGITKNTTVTQRNFKTNQSTNSRINKIPFKREEIFNINTSNNFRPLPPSNHYLQLDEYQDLDESHNIEEIQNFRDYASRNQLGI